ncbi:hypothetical protein WJX82_001284 [Trebouxia sp. C0006]
MLSSMQSQNPADDRAHLHDLPQETQGEYHSSCFKTEADTPGKARQPWLVVTVWLPSENSAMKESGEDAEHILPGPKPALGSSQKYQVHYIKVNRQCWAAQMLNLLNIHIIITQTQPEYSDLLRKLDTFHAVAPATGAQGWTTCFRIPDRQLTASQVYSLALALRPEQSRIQSFVQRLFRDNPSCTLGLKMLVPASINIIDRRNALARILRALVSIVTQDLKAAISIHAQAAQQPTPFKVFYDFDVIIQHLHGQGLEELYSETEQRFGESLAHQLFQKVVATCGVTGKKMKDISWKETGLAVLFGQLPSTQQPDPTLGVSTIDCEESGSAQLWAFTSLASQVVPVDRIEQVIDWL